MAAPCFYKVEQHVLPDAQGGWDVLEVVACLIM